MKRLFLLLFLAAGFSAAAQTAEKWEQIYGAAGQEYGYSVKTCLGQGYLVAGTTSSGGVTDGYIVRTDSVGLVMWSKYFVGNNIDVIRSVKQLPDSGFVLAGFSNSAGHGGYDGWLLRTDKNGDTLWTKYIGTTDWDFFYDVDTTFDGGFMLVGGTYGAGAGEEDFYLVRTDANGDTLWTRTVGGVKTEEAQAVVSTADTLYAACGFTYSKGDTLGDSWIVRFDDNGDTLWTRTTGIPNAEDKAWDIVALHPFGKLYIVGENYLSGNKDPLLHCLDYSGNTLFSLTNNFGGSQEDDFHSIVFSPPYYIATIGTTYSFGSGNGDFSFYTDNYGWVTTTCGTLQTDVAYSIDRANDKGFIASGYTTGYSSNLPNMYLVKLDSLGATSGVLSIREPVAAGETFAVTIFPNPSSTQATFELDAASDLSGDLLLEIFDVTGRNVMSVPASSWQLRNQRSAVCTADVSSLANGVYTYRISGKNGMTSGRLIKN